MFSGWIYDITETYDLSFYLAGFFIALSGLLLFVLPVTKRLKRTYGKLYRRETASASVSSVDENPAAITANGIIKKDNNNRIFV